MSAFMSLRLIAAAALSMCSACSSPGPTQTTPPSFAGTYSTVVAVTENACGSVTVMDMLTFVTHDVSTGSVQLSHAGTNYQGTVKADSTFSTVPLTLTFGDGNSYRMTIAGKFATKAFDALVTLDRTTIATGAMCRYVVRWIGTQLQLV